jgi:hypothetical protein
MAVSWPPSLRTAPRERLRTWFISAPLFPGDGQCLYECAPVPVKAHFEDPTRLAGEGWRIAVAAVSAQFLGLTQDEDLRSVMPRFAPHPIRTFRDAVQLGAGPPPVPCTYINCIGDKAFGQPGTMQADGIDDYREMRTGNDAMFSASQDVVEVPRKIAHARREVTAPDSGRRRA